MGYGSNSYQSAPGRGRRGYEEVGQQSDGGRMQTMEILSGKEYGHEFDESGSPSVIKSRWMIYGCVAFLLLIVVIAPHADNDNSNFKLFKNSNNQKANATTIPPSTKTASPSEETIAATSEPTKSATSEPTKPAATSEPKPTSEQEEGSWSVTSAPLPEEDPTFYLDICEVPSTYQRDANNFTFLNVSNFCLPEGHFANNQYGCRCKNPVKPISNPDAPPEQWNKTMQMNIELVNKAIAQPSQLDVVFLGDSIIEHWNGRDGGRFRDKDHNVSLVFDQLFHKKNGSKVEGLALGIAGDRCQNLLYRIQHGEMPPALNPKAWWLLIGTNDVGVDNCNADAITVGNIRIIEEIRRHYPQTPIVVNSLLPRGEELKFNPTWQVLQDINSQVKCYTETHPNLHFFDATNLFITETKENEKGRFFNINQTLMTEYLHPSGEGAMLWGQAIIKFLKDSRIITEP